MTTTDQITLFFAQNLLLPENPRGWEKFLERRSANARYADNPGKFRSASREWREKNPEKALAGDLKYRLAHPEETRRLQAARYASDPERERRRVLEYRKRNPDKVRQANAKAYKKNREKRAAYSAEWARLNPERRKSVKRAYEKKRRANDPAYKLLANMRSRMWDVLKNCSKSARTTELLGMEIPEFRIYLQGQFLPGMSWENYGSVWEVDHIRPCASFDLSDPAQQYECFHWSNHQPLFAVDNQKKWAHYVSR